MAFGDMFGKKINVPPFKEVFDAAVRVRKERAGEPNWHDAAQKAQYAGIDAREANYVAFRMLRNLGAADTGKNEDIFDWYADTARSVCLKDIEGLKGGAGFEQAEQVLRGMDSVIDKLVPPVRAK